MSIPSLIFCCEPHNVAAVDTIMDMVVKIESVMTGVVMTETAEENEIEMSKGGSSLNMLWSIVEGWQDSVCRVEFFFWVKDETALTKYSSTWDVTVHDWAGA